MRHYTQHTTSNRKLSETELIIKHVHPTVSLCSLGGYNTSRTRITVNVSPVTSQRVTKSGFQHFWLSKLENNG